MSARFCKAMVEVPKRSQPLTVALPASFTRDIPHLREKTGRVGIVARALAIFRVDHAIIYNDHPSKATEREGRLFEKLLGYLETPQYLRKTIFARDPDLQFAGTLPPLRLPSHPTVQKPLAGMVREGVVVSRGGSIEVDAGFSQPVRVTSRLKPMKRVTVRITRTEPELGGELVDPDRLRIYWGFRVSRRDSTLGRMIREEKRDLTISTSRKGRNVREALLELGDRWKSSRDTMVLFGSPDEGVPEILGREGIQVDTACDFNLNTIPEQGVATVRTEEALLATLSMLNILEEK